MNCRVNRLVFALMGAVCLVLLAGQPPALRSKSTRDILCFGVKATL